MEEEQPQSNTQHPPQEEAARRGEQPSPQAPLPTSTPAKGSPPSTDQESPINTPEKSPQSQNKLLWKPIPPLVPEMHSKTRDQSCQTEESSADSHGQNTGGKTFLPPLSPSL